MMNYYSTAWKRYAEFSGRSQRAEYWYFALINAIISIIILAIGSLTGSASKIFGLIDVIFSLAILIPSLAITVRRLHDTDHSGWWIFISLIPLIGGLIILYFTVLDSTPGTNQYGPNPKGVGMSAAAPTTPTPTQTV